MAIFRVEKNKNYTTMCNYHLRDKNLSLKAKGLLSFMLSLPEDWDYSLKGLVAMVKEQEVAVRSALQELKDYGYLKVVKELPSKENGGILNYLYNVFEMPQDPQNQDLQNLHLDNIGLDANNIYNKSKQNTEEQNTDNTKKEITKENNFAEFWALYPKQRAGSKAKAHASYMKVLKEKRATEEHLLAKVKEYANSREVREGFAKGCAAWLNDDRFNSDYNGVTNNGIGKDYNRENTGEYSGLGRKIGF